jgi:putative sterol carrier protein
MIGDAVRAVFEERRQRRFEPAMQDVSGSYRFDVDEVGSFFVAVDRGWLVVAEVQRQADCVIRCSGEDFLRVARGEQNLWTAAMQGLVEIRGDLALAQKLHGLDAAGGQAHERPGAQP